jgi:predicted porin
MKKSLLALAALSACVGSAQAQSSVSVYGLFDGGLSFRNMEQTTSAGAKTSTISNGFLGNSSASSRIGFRGTEDLGKGQRATFNLELGFNPGTGEVTTTTHNNINNATGANQGSETGVRTALVGLASKEFGSLDIGRGLTGIHGIVAGNVWGGNNMIGDITYSDFKPNTAAVTTGSITVNGTTVLKNGESPSVNAVSGRVSFNATRSSNMAVYTSPRIAGLQLRADYGNTVGTQANQPENQFAIKGIYANYNYASSFGNFTINAGSATVQGNAILQASSAFTMSKTIINAANAMYQAKGLTIQYTIAQNKTETITHTSNVQASKVKAQKLSASYQMGAVMPFVQYGIGTTQGATDAASVQNSTDDKGMQIGAEYSLSKRSNLYAAYGQQERKLINSSASIDAKQYAVGLRHVF